MPDLFLPPGVRYRCLRCGACCRTLEVTLTDAERERLLGAGEAGATPSLFARRRTRGRQAWQLRPLPDGACPFLTEDNLCRIHAALGPEAKPFAGRLFPFTFVVTPVGTFVGCRFNCPAVIRGEGEDIEAHRAHIKRLFGEYARTYTPPCEPNQVRFFGHFKLVWRDVLRFEDQLVAFLLMSELDVARRLLACWGLVRQFVGQAVRRGRGERMGADPNAVLEWAIGAAERRRPGRMERLLMRLSIAAFVGAAPHFVREMPFLRRQGLRLGNLWRRLKMALGAGRVRLPGLDTAVRLREIAELDLTALDAT